MAENTKTNTAPLNTLIANTTLKNNTPKNNTPKTNTPKNNSLKNNASKTGNSVASNANLNKEIQNILGETASTSTSNASKTNITKNNASKSATAMNINKGNNNNNNNNNTNNNLDNNLPENIGNASKKNQNQNKSKSEAPSMVDKGVDKLSDTFSNIKNSILGTPSAQNNSQKEAANKEAREAKEAKENKNRANREKMIQELAPEAEQKAEKGDSMWMLVIKVVIMVIILVAIYYIGNYLITRYMNSSANSPMLLNTTKNAKHAMVISQDPTSVNYIPILKSEGQDGIQFTYGFWFILENMDYKPGEWKHVFHKGNSSSYPNRAPGVWFHPNKNAVRVYMNTQDNILEYADIDNLPIRKWVYMNIILNNKNLDLYVNGYLKIRKELSGIPKQNDDDFWINMYGGFEGHLSNIRYYAYAIDFNEIYKNINAGPSTNNCIDTGEVPPYLDDNWWFHYNG